MRSERHPRGAPRRLWPKNSWIGAAHFWNPAICVGYNAYYPKAGCCGRLHEPCRGAPFWRSEHLMDKWRCGVNDARRSPFDGRWRPPSEWVGALPPVQCAWITAHRWLLEMSAFQFTLGREPRTGFSRPEAPSWSRCTWRMCATEGAWDCGRAGCNAGKFSCRGGYLPRVEPS